jgi:hypothetical protein
MWTGPLICWRVSVRNSTHVSYLLTAAGVNAGRLNTGGTVAEIKGPAAKNAELRLRQLRESGSNLERFVGTCDSPFDSDNRGGLGYSHHLRRSKQHSIYLCAAITGAGRLASFDRASRQRRLGGYSQTWVSNLLHLTFQTIRKPVAIPAIVLEEVAVAPAADWALGSAEKP